MQIKEIGFILVIISSLLLAISLMRKNEPFFNLREIIGLHLKMFQSCKTQYIVFYGLPLLLSVGLTLLFVASDAFFSELSIVLSIILSMHFSILSILSGFNFYSVKVEKQREKSQTVIIETTNSIIFNCLLCLFMLLYNLTMIIFDEESASLIPISVRTLKSVASGVAYYLFIVILLTTLLIIKQMSKLIRFNMDAKRGDNR